jgi:zinc transport system substrate-binding protein
MARAVGRDAVELTIIVPSGMCPGHFDVKPNDIANLSNADVILHHGFEVWMDKITSPETQDKLFKVGVPGNAMVPELHVKSAKAVTEALCKAEPGKADVFRKNMAEYAETINSTVQEMSGSLADLKGKKIACADMQEGFLKWIGFDIVVTYGRPEDITPTEMAEIIKTAKMKKVDFFVDNLQSGPKAGVTMSADVGAKHVALTNFPLGDTWDAYVVSLKDNISKLSQDKT